MSRSKLNKLGLDNSIFNMNKKKMYEDTTEYGEFISSFDSWITLEEQKRNADYLANIEKINAESEELDRFKG